MDTSSTSPEKTTTPPSEVLAARASAWCCFAEWRYQHTVSADRSVIHSDPETLGGTPVFVGTRVPLQALIDRGCLSGLKLSFQM